MPNRQPLPKTETATREATEALRLTDRQRLFLEAYLGVANYNGTEAARLAGYKGTYGSQRVIACENLKKPEIQAVISIHDAARREELAEHSNRFTPCTNRPRKARKFPRTQRPAVSY